MAWKGDSSLADDLAKYVLKNFKRTEVLDFVKRDYSCYQWSLPTLDRKLGFFGIKYIDMDNTLETVKDAVQKELNGPGKLLGYRAMTQKLRTEHGIKVPRNLVQNVLYDLDHEGVACRCLENRRKQRNQPFTSKG